jgi:hypothetical protein
MIPNPLHSYEQALKFEHLDLVSLSDFGLWQERLRTIRALEKIDVRDWDRNWLIERLHAIKVEQRVRRRGR